MLICRHQIDAFQVIILDDFERSILNSQESVFMFAFSTILQYCISQSGFFDLKLLTFSNFLIFNF